ncbi:hypothetical protein RRG08_046498 [Elysia crispata]|uniref:Replicase polyprotein 1a n=1 Tax=Elysia crispata TaxID=231223 RepID=A0AAE0YJ19_9GAST|nr:hypothetical protein RRG08_046498 [Elysia crispata]
MVVTIHETGRRHHGPGHTLVTLSTARPGGFLCPQQVSTMGIYGCPHSFTLSFPSDKIVIKFDDDYIEDGDNDVGGEHDDDDDDDDGDDDGDDDDGDDGDDDDDGDDGDDDDGDDGDDGDDDDDDDGDDGDDDDGDDGDDGDDDDDDDSIDEVMVGRRIRESSIVQFFIVFIPVYWRKTIIFTLTLWCISTTNTITREKATLFGPSGVYLPPTQSPARRRRFTGRQVYIYHQHNHPREGDALRAVRCISTTNTITREKATLYGPSGVYLPPTQSPARRRRFTGRQVYIYHQHNHPREGDALRAVRCISTTNTITREKATLFGPSGVYLPPTQSPARRRRFSGRQPDDWSLSESAVHLTAGLTDLILASRVRADCKHRPGQGSRPCVLTSSSVRTGRTA